jgi:hypothetical protein
MYEHVPINISSRIVEYKPRIQLCYYLWSESRGEIHCIIVDDLPRNVVILERGNRYPNTIPIFLSLGEFFNIANRLSVFNFPSYIKSRSCRQSVLVGVEFSYLEYAIGQIRG